MIEALQEAPLQDDSGPADRGGSVFGEQFFVAPLEQMVRHGDLPRSESTRLTNPQIEYTTLPGNPKTHTNDGVTYGDSEVYD